MNAGWIAAWMCAVAPAGADVLVASRGSDRVIRFDAGGAPVGPVLVDPALVRPVGVTFGPDGRLYVAAGDTDRVLRFDPATGALEGVFARGAALRSPRNLNFGPDGALYVADGMLNQILRFDGATGQLDRVFVQDPALQGPTSFTFGPDGHLYVVSVLTNRVLRFDGATGAFLGVFAATQLALPHDVAFGPDGLLYVTNSQSGLVQRYRGDTGEFVGTFVRDPALRNPLGLAWGPDGHLYVANQGGHEVRRYDGATGAFAGTLVAPGAGGLSAPSFLAFAPAPTLGVSAVARADGTITVAIAGARPGAQVLLVGGLAGGSSEAIGCPGVRLAIGSAQPLAGRVADEGGYAVVRLQPTSAGQEAALVALDLSRCLATAPVAIGP